MTTKTSRFSITFLFCFFLLLLAPQLKACTCYCGDYTVCSNMGQDVHFIKGYVYAYEDAHYLTWSIQVLDRLTNIPTSDSIVFDLPNTCSEPLQNASGDAIQLGDTIIFHGNFSETDSLGFDHFWSFSCGNAPLTYSQGWVYGAINTQRDAMPYDEFEAYVNSDPSEDIFCDYCDCRCFFSPITPLFELSNTFCGTLRDLYLEDTTLLIARARFTERIGHGFRTEIIEVIKGSESANEVTAWGLLGSECRKSADSMQVNQDYVIILKRITADDLVGADEVIGDYQIIRCGVHDLLIEGETVVGPITGSLTQMDYADMPDFINGGYLNNADCYEIVDATIEQKQYQADIRIFPNPTTDFVSIDLTSLPTQEVNLAIYNSSGQILSKQTVSAAASHRLSAESLPAKGVFLIQVEGKDFVYSKKLIRL